MILYITSVRLAISALGGHYWLLLLFEVVTTTILFRPYSVCLHESLLNVGFLVVQRVR
jgi:hypothetical protein